MKVVKIDKAATDYYIKLTNLQSEYRRIGVNYNQAVKALHTGLSEKKALAMLYKLEQLTIELRHLYPFYTNFINFSINLLLL